MRLNLNLIIPTPISFIEELLSYANSNFNFQPIIEEASIDALIVSANFPMKQFRQSTIGLKCLLHLLEELGFSHFAQDLISLIVRQGIQSISWKCTMQRRFMLQSQEK